MKLKPLSAALVGAGIAVVGTAGAFDLAELDQARRPQVAAAAPQRRARRTSACRRRR